MQGCRENFLVTGIIGHGQPVDDARSLGRRQSGDDAIQEFRIAIHDDLGIRSGAKQAGEPVDVMAVLNATRIFFPGGAR